MTNFKGFQFNLERLVNDLQKTLQGENYKEFYPKVIPIHKDYDKVINAFVTKIKNTAHNNKIDLKDLILKLTYDYTKNDPILEIHTKDNVIEINIGYELSIILKCDVAITSSHNHNIMIVGNLGK